MNAFFIYCRPYGFSFLRKGPAKSGGAEEEEIFSMLWGAGSSSAFGGGTDEDVDNGASKRRKSTKDTAATPKRAPKRRTQSGGVGPQQVSEVASTGDGSSNASTFASSAIFNAFLNPAAKKKAGSETKELDRSEAVVLQANQLKLQLQDSNAVMQLSMQKCNQLLEKLDSRLKESTKSFVDMIKSQGPGCRAETVWQNLKDSKALVEAIGEFVEALQDKEAAPETLHLRLAALRALNVTIPLQVMNIICQRSAQKMIDENRVSDMFEFLDPDCKDKHPDGISSVLPTDLSSDGLQLVVKEFQTGCITFAMNQFLLKEYAGDAGYFDLGSLLFYVL